MSSNKDLGKRLITQAERIMRWELKTAVENKDWNLTVRRSQEVVELSLKGALKILGIDFPKVHDVGMIFTKGAKEKGAPLQDDTLTRIQEVSKWLAEARAPAFYVERSYSKEVASKARRDAVFVLQATKSAVLKSTKQIHRRMESQL
nr:HEPN domain-containing protein [Candidatus Njordarchaeum guaymaensis]